MICRDYNSVEQKPDAGLNGANMKIKYMTKRQLNRINAHAMKNLGRAIEPSFVKSLPPAHGFPVDRAIPFHEKAGWVRCFITVGTTVPPKDDELKLLILDMTERDFHRLKTVDCPHN